MARGAEASYYTSPPEPAGLKEETEVRWVIRVLGAAAYLFIYLGLILHSSGGPVLGRYSWLYFLGLLGLGLASLPGLFLLRFLTTDAPPEDGEADEAAAPRRASARRKMLVAAALALAAAVIGELVIQGRVHRQARKQVAKLHPFLQIQGRPNKASSPTNSHGFRGEPIARDKPAGVFRIFFMGGSTVQCRSVDFEASHVRLLEKRLRARYPERRIEVQNVGHEWYTTRHSLSNYLFRLKDFKPDALILYHGINDLCRSFAPARFASGPPRADYAHFWGPMAGPALTPFHRSPLPYPYLLGWLGQDFLYSDLLAARPTAIDDFASLRPFERNLRSLVAATRADGARLMLATQPYSYREDMSAEERALVWMNSYLCEQDGRYPDISSMARGLAAFNDATRRVAASAELPLVDLAAGVPKDGVHFRDGVHYREAGNQVIAGLVFEAIERARWLEGGG